MTGVYWGTVAGLLAAVAILALLIFGLARCPSTEVHSHFEDGEYCWHEHAYPWWADTNVGGGHTADDHTNKPCHPRGKP